MTEEKVQDEQEMATESQEAPSKSELGDAIAESKKYRNRAQKAEAKIAEMEKTIEANRTKQLEEQNEWKTLAEERKAQIDELNPIVKQYKADEAKYCDELLSGFSDEDREVFRELPLKQLRTVHSKLTTKTINVPNVDSSPPGETEGYESATDAARAYSKGEIDSKSFQKIRTAFANKIRG